MDGSRVVPPLVDDELADDLELFESADGSLLDLVDHLLNQGVVISGEVVLGLADVDLIYLRLSVLLCAADRVLPRRSGRDTGESGSAAPETE